MNDTSPPSQFELKQDNLSDHQFEQAKEAISGRIGLLTGGPGTGKTYVAATILKAIAAQRGTHNLAVCAPTGKAAVRITEALQKNGLNLTAKTIHRTLGVTRNGHDGGGWGFHYGTGNPLPVTAVCVDEVSMLDASLAASLFSALRPHCYVLLVGDEGQLPPVQHGAVFRDFLAAEIPCGQLIEIWRNAGDIVKCCAAIRNGEPWEPSPLADREQGWNFVHLECRTASVVLGRLEKLLRSLPADLDPIWDLQIVVAINDNTPLARKQINPWLQAILNPNGASNKTHQYRVGDKVICLRNQFLPLVDQPVTEKSFGFDPDSFGRNDEKPDEAAEEFVANGDMGEVTHVDDWLIHVRFDTPIRHCVVKPPALKGEMDLAYAVTVHKSQGSQWPVVVYISDQEGGARRVSCRELIYTALSRAEDMIITMGRLATIYGDCQKESLSQRKTFLRELICEPETMVF